jgi:hypothetical protein
MASTREGCHIMERPDYWSPDCGEFPKKDASALHPMQIDHVSATARSLGGNAG